MRLIYMLIEEGLGTGKARGLKQFSKGAVFQKGTINCLGHSNQGEGHNISQLHHCGQVKPLGSL